MKTVSVAVVGATGAVGQEILNVMHEHKFPYHDLKLLASKRSAGQVIQFEGKDYVVEETTADSFEGVDIAFFAGGPASREFGRVAQAKGAIVIDNSSTFRLEPDVPLIVPEVNGEAAKNHQGLIACPNCSTILLVGAINPIHKKSKVKKIIVSTYQAVSGAGKEGITELVEQTSAVLNGQEIKSEVFQHQIAFNLIPHIDVWMDEAYTKEEMKLVYETHKILGDDTIAITPTAVRVPVIRSHAESIQIELENKVTADEARALLKDAERVIVRDEPENKVYPMPIETAHHDDIFVGRIRNDLYNDHALNLWVCFDQIRKGAATNTVQIAELLLEKGWLQHK